MNHLVSALLYFLRKKAQTTQKRTPLQEMFSVFVHFVAALVNFRTFPYNTLPFDNLPLIEP